MAAYLPGCKPPTIEYGQSFVTTVDNCSPMLTTMNEAFAPEALKDYEEVKLQLEWVQEIVGNFEFATLCDLGNVVR